MAAERPSPPNKTPSQSSSSTGNDVPPQSAGHPEIVAHLREEIARAGSITLARFMEIALYDPEHGYYQTAQRRPGRGGDFLTSPELHPFFGFTLARQIAECWRRLDRPAIFTVREYGPGVGGLAYDIIAAIGEHAPEVRAALRYRLVDVNSHRMRDALAAMAEVGLGDVVSAETPGDAANDPIAGVVLANEVADAFPVHQLIVRGGALRERFVAWDDDAAWFAWAEAPLSDEIARLDISSYLERAGVDMPNLPDGSLLEISPAAADWIAELSQGLARGYALIVDYGYPAAELYRGHRLGGLLRGYRAHTVTDDPFAAIGEQDLTAHVDFTTLIEAAERSGMAVAGLTTQADFLTALGMGDFLVDLQRQEGIDLERYYQSQAAVMRLIDPGGLGRFRVLGLAKDAPIAPPLRGFAALDLAAELSH